jgi:hypothetical protein
LEIEVLDAKIRDLLHPRPGVVEKEEQRAIA